MTTTLDRAHNFRIDALLAHDTDQRSDSDGASPVLSHRRSPGPVSPVSPHGSGTPSPHPAPTNSTAAYPGVLSKSQLFSLSQSGFAALQQGGLFGVHPGSMYPLAAFGGQHHAFLYPGFSQMVHSYPQQLKAASMVAGHPLEPWIRAGMMMPKEGEYGGEWICLF